MSWGNKQILGFSAASFEEFQRILKLGVVSMIEINLGGFAKTGTPLYFYDGKGGFIPNNDVIGAICAKTRAYGKDIQVQFHLPLEEVPSLKAETGINVGLKKHHEIALARFRLLEAMYRQTEIGSVITMHPPLIWRYKQLIEEKEAVENARLFFARLDGERRQNNAKTKIGIENQADGKDIARYIGDKPEYFEKMLTDTRTIGITFDAGHRRLSKNVTIRGFLRLGIPIVNFHFHGNAGIFDKNGFDDDQHELPTRDNVNGYENYLKYFRRHRVPITLEIKKENLSEAELVAFVAKLKKEIE